jgi:asparagine synthase (glutamine-hydrolysing)
MCGITGLVMRDRAARVDLPVLERMTEIVRHRGPDDGGVQTWGNVGFGHRRLAIVDLESGQQPMSTADGSLWVTFNGELYNYVELRGELTQRGCRLRTYSDTEVLLHLYACYGLKMFEHMNGMFAFALYDRPQRRIVLARDRLGEKPLYYYRDAGRLAFASEIKALTAVPGFRVTPDTAAIHEYLTFQYCLGDRTFFEGVRKLPPASYAVLDDAGDVLEQATYWSVDFREDHSRGEDYWVDELRFLLEDSVKTRLRSDVPVGAYVSGGVDSGVVASLAAKLFGHGVPMFTGYFAEPGFSELPHAEALARATNSPHRAVCPSPSDFAEQFQRLIYHLDEPTAGPGAFPQLMVAALASQHVKVVLGGQGGDEIFGGYARYLLMYLEESLKGSIFQSQDPSRHIVTLDRVLPNLAMLQQYVPLLKDFWSHGLFEPVERRYYSLVTRMTDLAACFSPDFLAERDDGAIYDGFERQFNDILRRVPDGRSALFNRMTAYDLRTMLQSLLHVEDRMSMAASLESRLPLLDHRIIDLMFRVPPVFKYRDGKAKAILLKTAQSLLPQSILDRRDKMGFPVPFVEWARGPLRGFVSDVLLSKAARERGIYRTDGIAELVESGRPYGRELWGLLCLEMWFQTFADGRSPARA